MTTWLTSRPARTQPYASAHASGGTGGTSHAGLRIAIDSMLRDAPRARRRQGTFRGREWAFVDTRDRDPGAYLIREWTDASGISRAVERLPGQRVGGSIGLFTLQAACVSVGPCPPGVDEGAGLLLVGFVNMLALPLPPGFGAVFEANWLRHRS